MKPLPDWVRNPPTNLKDKVTLLTSNRHLIKSKGPRGQALRRLWKEINDENTLLQARAREIQPLAFFKPSYEQALILNAWMYGVSFIAVYTANRIGKTTAAIINILLWIIPNNPKWLIFHPYIDEFGRKVQVFPRPNISHVRLIHRFLKRLQRNATPESPAPKPDPSLPTYDPINRPFLQSLQNPTKGQSNLLKPAWPDHPWPGGGTIWFGAPDHDHHEKILFPLWKQYIPQPILDRYSPSQKEITLTIQSTPDPNNPNHKGILPKITVWELVGKSYESKDTKWSSGAVDIITLTEGVTPDTMKEINMRFKDPGIGSHDFTPYEPANSGAASHLAQQIYKRQFKLSPVLHVFTKFSMRMAPSHIMSPELKAARIESLEGDPESKARIDGEFYTSSALVLSNLHRDHHLLPYTKAQFDLLLQSNNSTAIQPHIFRGIDPGLDHPTACVWAYLLPSNQWVVYRVLSQRALSIPERCKRIIELSGNVQSKIYYGPKTPASTEFYEIETHPSPSSEVATATIIDYHVFKEDETTGQPYALNYLTKGLPIIESVHIGPEDRAMEFDAKLELSPYLPSLMPPEHIKELMHHHNEKLCNHCKLPNALTDPSQSHSTQSSLQGMPPGAGIYFLQYGDGVLPAFLKWEDFYWERKKSGDDKGSPKDQLPTHGDDELDAASYITCSQFRWTSYFPSARMVGDSEPESDMIEWAQAHKRQPVSESSLQSLQKLVPAGAGFFGGDED